MPPLSLPASRYTGRRLPAVGRHHLAVRPLIGWRRSPKAGSALPRFAPGPSGLPLCRLAAVHESVNFSGVSTSSRLTACLRRDFAFPSAARSLTTPGLRFVTPVRSPLLDPRRCAFPTFGRYDPAPRDVGRLSGDSNGNASVESFGVPTVFSLAALPIAFRRAASCRRATIMAGHPGPPASGGSAVYPARRHRAGSCDGHRGRRLACCALQCARSPARTRHPAEEPAGHRAPPLSALGLRAVLPLEHPTSSDGRGQSIASVTPSTPVDFG